jgi:hypothetical protein
MVERFEINRENFTNIENELELLLELQRGIIELGQEIEAQAKIVERGEIFERDSRLLYHH